MKNNFNGVHHLFSLQIEKKMKPSATIDLPSMAEISSEMEHSASDHHLMVAAITKELFSNAMNGNWEKVVKLYETEQVARQLKITKSGDTAIHVAIGDNQEDIVEKLVTYVSSADLEIENELGNTPLHQAATLGNVKMCECIAKKNRDVIGKLNGDNETPFFLAVLHGKKGAFLCLHSLCKKEDAYRYCRRKNDGYTILHAAITGEYFEIAFEIINHYDYLIDSLNVEGFSPLHLLANKPSAFKSGSHVSGFQKLIYHCIFVDELQHHSNHHILSKDLEYDPKAHYPENYHTCVALISFLRTIGRVLLGKSSRPSDTENPKTVPTQVESSNHVEKQQGDVMGQQYDSEIERKLKIFRAQGHQLFPENYRTCFDGLKLFSKTMMILLGFGTIVIQKLREKKQKHIWSVQIMRKLLEKASLYEYEDNGRRPPHLSTMQDGTTPYSFFEGGDVVFSHDSLLDPFGHDDHSYPPSAIDRQEANQNKAADGNGDSEKALEMAKKETPILIAAKNGVMEMVKMILELFPVAIHDMDDDKKNIVLLAVENRQPAVYQYLVKHRMKETIFRKTDKNGNSALHLAAMLGDHRPWRIPGAALQMQWEIKWYKFVKDSMALHFFVRYNKAGLTPRHIFTKDHEGLVRDGGEWLTNTSQSCSVVAALIATVAFATSATVPGGVDQESGVPILESQPAFGVFAITSLIALCFSVTSLVMFLSILTSRYQEKDFGKSLPRKLLVGMSSLFVSIASMLVSFCAGHFFVLKQKLQYVAFPVYAITCLPVTFFAILQFPLYFDLVMATLTKVPRRSFR
ncbi:uncharacterized protein LOC127244363 [Andrographis paniculata]|uniref:uncharacterized protein LOC127244363 n=1 Tax=Andrographis paniculata TaxID=175694 RepID=UPI0021E96AFA|nr:uncharacterized protein LOC127244363 [Andrographis paniculata]